MLVELITDMVAYMGIASVSMTLYDAGEFVIM